MNGRHIYIPNLDEYDAGERPKLRLKDEFDLYEVWADDDDDPNE